jgi:putative spermidine/putrescine transport system ATP-binding protein
MQPGTEPSVHGVDEGPTPARLSIVEIQKAFPGVQALRCVSLGVREGEFVTLLGPSGSGKTTLLMVIAGFETPSGGHIMLGHRDITAERPEHRNFGVVFQNYALFPQMTVRRNVAYPLAARKIRGPRQRAIVDEALSLVGLEGLDSRRPSQLSGGQQQRVALARALVYRPSLLLLDEPLGALDRALRQQMQTELRTLNQRVGVTFLYVTHDQEEALTMSDRVAVLRDGAIEQVGTPIEVYNEPATRFVATFLGTSNLIEGTVSRLHANAAEVSLDLGSKIVARHGGSASLGQRVTVMLRPEKIDVQRIEEGEEPGRVLAVGRLVGGEFAGSTWRYSVTSPSGQLLQAHTTRPVPAGVDDPVALLTQDMEGWILQQPRTEKIGT